MRGTGGTLWAERYVQDIGYAYTPNGKFSKEPAAKTPAKAANAETILRNWLECMRDRRKPVADEEEGYYSSIACYMANQAFQKKARVAWDAAWDIG